MSQKKRKAPRHKRTTFNTLGYLAIVAVVLTIAGVTWVSGLSLKDKIAEYEIKEMALRGAIEEEEERTVKLEEKKKYIQTKQYYEEIAHDRFGLVYPNEIVYRPKQN